METVQSNHILSSIRVCPESKTNRMQNETFKPAMLIAAVCTFAAGMITAMFAAAGYL